MTSVLRTLPTLDRGRSGQTSTCLGTFTLPRRSLTKARISSPVTVWPGRGWTTAVTRSPHLSPGAAYAVLDGLFQSALLHCLAGDEDAAHDLAANVVRILDTLEVRKAPA